MLFAAPSRMLNTGPYLRRHCSMNSIGRNIQRDVCSQPGWRGPGGRPYSGV
jgi:hypothetical protein